MAHSISFVFIVNPSSSNPECTVCTVSCWKGTAARPSWWTNIHRLLLPWSASDLDRSHYGGISPRGRAGPDWLSSTPWGLCFLQQLGQPWINLGSRRLIPPVSNPHTSESRSTAGGLKMTVHCQGPADTRSYNSCIQLLFSFFVTFPAFYSICSLEDV